MEFIFKLCHKSAINNDIPLALQNDPKSPLYRIWQSTSNPSTGNVTQVSEKQRRFQDLFSSWKNKNQNEAQLFVIPLDHSYENLSRSTLKGIDRLMTDIIYSLLGDFAEIHFAIVTRFVGFNDDDWATSYEVLTERKKRGELHWTDY